MNGEGNCGITVGNQFAGVRPNLRDHRLSLLSGKLLCGKGCCGLAAVSGASSVLRCNALEAL